MAENDTLDTALMFDSVYEGVWEKYGETLLQRWIWTVSDAKAIVLFGVFGLLLTFTQTRSWVLIRYIICLKKRTVRLASNDPDPLQHLSQARAILDVLPFFANHISRVKNQTLRLGRHPGNTGDVTDSSVIPPSFGFLATLNLLLFLFLSVAIPAQLSEGTPGKAIVRSRVTKRCLASSGWKSGLELKGFLSSLQHQQREADAIFQICDNEINRRCGSQYQLEKPRITKRRIESCMFPVDICRNGSTPFEITHWNITAREVGLNLKSKVQLNHRLTCAPIKLDPFLHFDKIHNRTTLSIEKKTHTGFELPPEILNVTLNTMNGPNKFSTENSGYRMANERGPEDISVLPEMAVSTVGTLPWSYRARDNTREELIRNDGVSFLVIYRAGMAIYIDNVDDPFFAAHHEVVEPPRIFPVYYPDYEATGLGCLEQFQYYLSTHKFSTSWGMLSEQLAEIEKYLEEKKSVNAAEDVSALEIIPPELSVHAYLTKRLHGYTPVPLTENLRGLGALETPYNPEQWIRG